jgi:hypothetical protein
MSSLDDDFATLRQRLLAPGSLNAAGSDPFFYFVYPPAEALTVKRMLPVWTAQLRLAGLEVERVSFSDLLWELVDATGRWESWLAAEADFEPEEVNAAMRSILRDDVLVRRVAQIVEQPRPRSVVFLTETEMLHPYFRVRALESALHDRIKTPTVVFYPGLRKGHFGLQFLGFYPEDNNYRATPIGGLA